MTDSRPSDSPGATVHLIFSSAGYVAARARCSSKDALVLIGDGVYALSAIALEDRRGPVPALQVLQDDLAQRGVPVPQSVESIALIDDLTLVDIISAGNHTVSWR